MLEASVADDDDVGSFVGRDEPAEHSYDYAEADRRALDVFRRVVQAEGGDIDPGFESAGDGSITDARETALPEAQKPDTGGKGAWLPGPVARYLGHHAG
jgi:hypothetical protein